MLPVMRRELILQTITERNAVKVSELSSWLKVTEETIRRDLEELAKRKFLRRVHGGAVTVNRGRLNAIDLTISERELLNRREKVAIARAAVQLIREGETIFLDASTTVLAMAPYLAQMRNLNLLTNSVRVVIELKKAAEINVVCIGGTLRREGLSFVGTLAEETIRKFHADKVFLSGRGITIEHGLTDFSELTSQVKKVMLDSSVEKICLVDSSKFGVNSFTKITDLRAIDCIVTDANLKEVYQKQILGKGIRLITADLRASEGK